MVYIVEKGLFEMRVPFLKLRPCKKYTSFFNVITCRVLAKYCFILKNMNFYTLCFTF